MDGVALGGRKLTAARYALHWRWRSFQCTFEYIERLWMEVLTVCTGWAIPRRRITIRMGRPRNRFVHRTLRRRSSMVRKATHPSHIKLAKPKRRTTGASSSPAPRLSAAASKPRASAPRTSSPSSSAKSSPSTASSCPSSSPPRSAP